MLTNIPIFDNSKRVKSRWLWIIERLLYCKMSISYKIFPPPNHLSNWVGVLVPVLLERSTKRLVASAYDVINQAGIDAWTSVKMHPMNMRQQSHFEANRYWTKKDKYDTNWIKIQFINKKMSVSFAMLGLVDNQN